MTDEATLKRWAHRNALDAAKYIHSDDLYSAKRDLAEAARWVDRAIEAETKREAEEEKAALAAAYPELVGAS